MNFKTLSPLLFLATALAQSINIATPADGSTVTAGVPTTVELDFPNSLTGVQHVSVVISWIDCSAQPCNMNASTILGEVLFSGNYTPAIDPNDATKPPHQNFTVSLPTDVTMGTSLLNVAHFMLIGASAEPILEFKNVSFNLAPPPPSSSQKRYIRGRSV